MTPSDLLRAGWTQHVEHGRTYWLDPVSQRYYGQPSALLMAWVREMHERRGRVQ